MSDEQFEQLLEAVWRISVGDRHQPMGLEAVVMALNSLTEAIRELRE